MIKVIDRYLLKSFLLAFTAVTVSVGLTIVVINVIEELPEFIDNSVPLGEILEYYLYFAGWVVKSFTPMFVMLAVLFTVSLFARRQEILAMKASGMSLYRIALPFVVVAIIISGLHFYYNEFIYPPANKRKVEIKNFTIERKSRSSVTSVRNIYRQIDPSSFYTLSQFDVDRREGKDFRLFRAGNGRASEIVTAPTIVFHAFRWKAINGVRRTFNDATETGFSKFDTLVVPDIDDKPDDLAKRMGKPEDMGMRELKQYIDLMKRTGGPYLRESVDLKIKYTFPLTSLIVVLVCIPFAANARRAGIAVSIAAGALIALVYFVAFRMLQSAGWNGKIPEEIAAWAVNAVFLLVGIILMLRAPK